MHELLTAVHPLDPNERDGKEAVARIKAADNGPVDRILLGIAAQTADGWINASYITALTERLKVLIAHRPGFMQPTLAARMTSTLDILSGGRVAVNIVTGGSDKDQRRDGDFLEKARRYDRSAEYVDVMKRAWYSPEKFDHEGEFYTFEGVRQFVRPLQESIPVYAGGASEAGIAFAAKHADVYMTWAEPLAGVQERVNGVQKHFDQMPHFSVSFRLIVGDTSEQAWETARTVLAEYEERRGGRPSRPVSETEDVGRRRQFEAAQSQDVHDTCFWTGITRVTDGLGSTSALVGTEDTILDALSKYRELGADTFLITGPRGVWDESLTSIGWRMKQEL